MFIKKKITIKKNLLQHWKKISFFIFIALFFLWSYALFYQKPREEYFTIKGNELKTEDISRQYALAAQKRYQSLLAKQSPQKNSNRKIFTKIEFEHSQKILTKEFQELEIIIIQEIPTTNKHQDFFLWNKKITFQTTYKPLLTILELIAKQGWNLSNITITNLAEHSKDPLLKIELLFSIIISKL